MALPVSASALSSVKLRKAKQSKATTKREETKFAKQLCEDESDYYRLVKETFFEAYYDKIKDFTFETEYLSLSKDDIRALRTEYNRLEGPFAAAGLSEEALAKASLTFEMEENLSKTPGDLIKEMSEKIDGIKGEHGWTQMFVRMSIRSPKDAALSSQRFRDILEKEYSQLLTVYGSEPPEWVALSSDLKSMDESETAVAASDSSSSSSTLSEAGTKSAKKKKAKERRLYIWKHNLRIIACYRAQTYALAVESGQQALELMSRSKRIQGDMHSLLDGTYSEDFQFCVREFRFFDPSFEFRSFVYKGKLTGLTQYNDLCFFPDLYRNRDGILKKIEEFVPIALEKLEMENMVLDLVLVDPPEKANEYYSEGWPSLSEERLRDLQVFVIEVNPLAEFAGGGLFEWNADKDVLLGDKPFEFRIQSKLNLYASSDLMPEWKPFVYPSSETDAGSSATAAAAGEEESLMAE